MIKQGSLQWKSFLKFLQKSKKKNNRDVLCTQCWEVFTYERNLKHKNLHPDHSSSILTSMGFATEGLFIKLSNQFNKIEKRGTDAYFYNPYKTLNLNKKTLDLKLLKK